MNKHSIKEKHSDLDFRNYSELNQSFEISNHFVEKHYLNELSQHEVVPIPENIKDLSIMQNIRLFKVGKLTYDKRENNLDKLSSVYNTLGNMGSSVIMIVDNDGEQTNLYIGTKTISKEQSVNPAKDALEKSINGNFPGSKIEVLRNSQVEKLLTSVIENKSTNQIKVVSAVSGIPSLKDKDKTNFVQGIEKLVDAMKGERFSAIFIADAVTHDQMTTIRRGYENLYSQLVPFLKSDLQFGHNDSHAITEGISKGFTTTVNESLTKTQSYTSGESESTSKSTNSSKTRSTAGLAGGAGALAGLAIGGPVGAIIGGSIGGAIGSALGSTTTGESTNTSRTKNSSTTAGDSETKGTSEANSETENHSNTSTTGHSKNLSISFENKSVKNLLEKIDDQLLRLKQSEDYGMWNSACYFIADDLQTSTVAASTFKAIIRGENSAIENSYINTWAPDNINTPEINKYLEKLSHPLVHLDVEYGLSLPYVTAGSLISGRELPLQIGLPQKSINGLPVIEMAEFGRNVMTNDLFEKSSTVKLGHVYHMGKKENTELHLDIKSLAMHTFITGSTGSGKSNATYQLVKELNKKGIKFLVIEPTKGEYKQVFGGRSNVSVFGTNPKYSPLLKINPFRFPEDIHVLEHIDRLVEMFNACWPMYAAMPAILKDAIEQTYEKVGWDLEDSITFDNKIFPTFSDLLNVLPDVINDSSYSEEMKGNYIGALITRVKSLTNGLIGRMFTDDEVDNHDLFDENCIIDLSRIGSIETKSLLMAIIFMRLQEHRQSIASDMNSELKHITVLEEAHHLLRRTSNSQSQEGANLQGKSVEMISNAIAEMRTYGEGFIIADQSPNLLDQSVIRNTNTKLILRLPDGLDREEVGQSASLNKDQMNEIPKLPTGVAVVYQNNWLQPVLCSIDLYDNPKPYVYKTELTAKSAENKKRRNELFILLLNTRVSEENKLETDSIDIEELQLWLNGLCNISIYQKELLLSATNEFQKNGSLDLSFEQLSDICSNFFDYNKCIRFAKEATNLTEWNYRMTNVLRYYVDLRGNEELEAVLVQCFLHEKAKVDNGFENFYFTWVEQMKANRRVLI
jgi:DNA helicase HerA-like ATPase